MPFFSGVKHFWVIKDNTSVINKLKSLNKRRKCKSVNSFDFSTLYTNDHDIAIFQVIFADKLMFFQKMY